MVITLLVKYIQTLDTDNNTWNVVHGFQVGRQDEAVYFPYGPLQPAIVGRPLGAAAECSTNPRELRSIQIFNLYLTEVVSRIR